MRCQICKNGETQKDTTTVTFENDTATLVFKSVPAEVCNNCGEVYIDEKTTSHLLELAEKETRDGVQVDIRKYTTQIA